MKSRPIALLFTTFPVATETFLQREVRILQRQGLPLQLYSLWQGQREFEGIPIQRCRWGMAWQLLWRLPWELLRSPEALAAIAQEMLQRPAPSALNRAESLWGVVWALLHAGRFRRHPPRHIHAVWASMPATAALVLSRLCGAPWSMGAHAYDVWEDGGDWLLAVKLQKAAFTRTSTAFAARRLREVGGRMCRPVHVIRRSLDVFPAYRPVWTSDERPWRLLAVGRLVAKMGYPTLLELLAELQSTGQPFHCRIAGEGPLREALLRQRERLGLGASLELLGHVEYAAVQAQMQWADVLVFMGQTAASGDEVGLPNAIAEAMAVGLPVVARPAGAVAEAIQDGVTGRLLPDTLAGQCGVLQQAQLQDSSWEQRRLAARRWVESHFDPQRNGEALRRLLLEA